MSITVCTLFQKLALNMNLSVKSFVTLAFYFFIIFNSVNRANTDKTSCINRIKNAFQNYETPSQCIDFLLFCNGRTIDVSNNNPNAFSPFSTILDYSQKSKVITSLRSTDLNDFVIQLIKDIDVSKIPSAVMFCHTDAKVYLQQFTGIENVNKKTFIKEYKKNCTARIKNTMNIHQKTSSDEILSFMIYGYNTNKYVKAPFQIEIGQCEHKYIISVRQLITLPNTIKGIEDFCSHKYYHHLFGQNLGIEINQSNEDDRTKCRRIISNAFGQNDDAIECIKYVLYCSNKSEIVKDTGLISEYFFHLIDHFDSRYISTPADYHNTEGVKRRIYEKLHIVANTTNCVIADLLLYGFDIRDYSPLNRLKLKSMNIEFFDIKKNEHEHFYIEYIKEHCISTIPGIMDVEEFCKYAYPDYE